MRVVISAAAARDEFKIVESAFRQAMSRHPHSVNESTFVFAGHHVRVRVVGRTMAEQLVQPFSHLQLDEPDARVPHLTIDLWDEDETNVRCGIRAPMQAEPRPTITRISPEGRFFGQQKLSSFTCYDRGARHLIGSVTWNRHLSVYERCRPLDRPLLEWHNDQQVQIIHAGLVAHGDRGVLLVGKGGSGKSTCAVACVSAGFGFLSEDFVGLQTLADGSFRGHSIYNSIFLEPDHLRRFPILDPHTVRGAPADDKSCVMLAQVFPERLRQAGPIRVVVLPKVVDSATTRFRPASKGEALLALGPSSLLQLPNRRLGARGLAKLTQLVTRAPCYWLEIGNDLARIPRQVEEILADVGSQSASGERPG